MYLSKFDSAGSWQWSKVWGGTDGDEGYTTMLDQVDNILVVGRFGDTVDFNPDGGDPQTDPGMTGAFLWKGNY